MPARTTARSALRSPLRGRVGCPIRLVEDREVWDAAFLMIERHGDGATGEAVVRALERGADGDARGEAAWRRIAVAVAELLRAPTGPAN